MVIVNYFMEKWLNMNWSNSRYSSDMRFDTVGKSYLPFSWMKTFSSSISWIAAPATSFNEYAA